MVLNIRKFHKGGVNGGEYGKFTLFYAGNGLGKAENKIIVTY